LRMSLPITPCGPLKVAMKPILSFCWACAGAAKSPAAIRPASAVRAIVCMFPSSKFQSSKRPTGCPPAASALASPVDEARGFDVGFELLRQRPGLQHDDLRRQLEALLHLRRDRLRQRGGVGSPAQLDREPQDVVAALVQRLGAEVADLEVAE